MMNFEKALSQLKALEKQRGQDLVELERKYSPGHPEVRAAKRLLNATSSEIARLTRLVNFQPAGDK